MTPLLAARAVLRAALAFCATAQKAAPTSSQNRPDFFTISAGSHTRPERRTHGDTARAARQPPRTGTYGYQPGTTLDIARLPIPGNAELLIYVVVLLVFALIAIFDDQVSADRFVWGATWVTVGYFVSRGLAKATRVLEQ